MSKRKFLVPNLATAGFMAFAGSSATASVLPQIDGVDPRKPEKPKTLAHQFSQDVLQQLAQHRSHSSHGSHSSHRSSSGGSRPRSTPTPAPAPKPVAPKKQKSNSTPPASILPLSPATAQPKTSSKFTETVKRVQSGLYAYGYYTGEIDGIVGTDTKAAITKFQTDFQLNVTGTITPEVLSAFSITSL